MIDGKVDNSMALVHVPTFQEEATDNSSRNKFCTLNDLFLKLPESWCSFRSTFKILDVSAILLSNVLCVWNIQVICGFYINSLVLKIYSDDCNKRANEADENTSSNLKSYAKEYMRKASFSYALGLFAQILSALYLICDGLYLKAFCLLLPTIFFLTSCGLAQEYIGCQANLMNGVSKRWFRAMLNIGLVLLTIFVIYVALGIGF